MEDLAYCSGPFIVDKYPLIPIVLPCSPAGVKVRADMQKRTNVRTMFVQKNPISGKIFAKLYAVLSRK